MASSQTTLKNSAIPRWWLSALASALVAVGGLIATPRMYESIKETRLLERSGVSISGKVIGHRPQTGKNKCSSSATVQYVVAGQAYEVSATGCGALPESSPLGTHAVVVFARSAPAVAHASIPGASTQRSTWWLLAGLWSGAALLAVVSRFVWRYEQFPSGPRRSAA